MIFPKSLKEKSRVGICAPSAGVGRKIDSFNTSIANLSREFDCVETASVRVDDLRSADAKTRGEEFNSLLIDDSVDMIMAAAGGDFLYEVLPYIDFFQILTHPKYVMGASDPTSILYTITTNYDVATIYGLNAGSYELEHRSIDENLEILKGKEIEQKSFDFYNKTENWVQGIFELDTPVKWISTDEIHVSGRCIGGCIDVLKDIIGTKYDGTRKFIDKYAKEGIIWYFDNFSQSAENMYRTLLQMRYAGYFEGCKAVIIGRVCFESSETGMSYEEGFKKALQDIPYVYNADVGHTFPHMTMVNGGWLTLSVNEKEASLLFEFK